MLRDINREISIPGIEAYPLSHGEPVMRIADELLKSVGFVSRYDPTPDGGSSLKFGGTAFIVGIEMEKNAGLAHLVTAKHVAEAIEPAEAVIAMNAKDGQPLYLRTGNTPWFYHPTEKDSVDVAVIQFGSVRFNDYDITWLPEDMFATNRRIEHFNLGLGDEIIVVGLFTRFSGFTRLTPIVRTGNIAMMPKDSIPVKGFGPMEAYLAEGRSIGGLSGSPVFVRHTLKLPVATKTGTEHLSGLGSFHLLGLMHGHWEVPTAFANTEEAEAVNMGVSIVVPAKKILEVLYHPELVAMRKEYWENNKKDAPQYPTQDTTLRRTQRTDKGEEIPVPAKSDFFTDLTKATRKTQ